MGLVDVNKIVLLREELKEARGCERPMERGRHAAPLTSSSLPADVSFQLVPVLVMMRLDFRLGFAP